MPAIITFEFAVKLTQEADTVIYEAPEPHFSSHYLRLTTNTGNHLSWVETEIEWDDTAHIGGRFRIRQPFDNLHPDSGWKSYNFPKHKCFAGLELLTDFVNSIKKGHKTLPQSADNASGSVEGAESAKEPFKSMLEALKKCHAILVADTEFEGADGFCYHRQDALESVELALSKAKVFSKSIDLSET